MKGVYLLIIRIKEKLEICVGRLGRVVFMPGIYAYVGSGMNNLAKRVGRHLRGDKKVFWHIDYLLEEAEIIGIITIESNYNIECEIAKLLSCRFKTVKGFGSSDCHCKGHLFLLCIN